MKQTCSRIAALTLLAGMSWLAVGCVSTFKEVKPLALGPPPSPRPSAMALAEVRITDARVTEAEQEQMTTAFQVGVEQWYAEHKTLELLRHVGPTNVPPGAILLNGTITEVEKGSAAMRFWVGMGAGQQRVSGRFELRSSDGATLAAFTARKSYLGGQGIGGWVDQLSVQDLIGQLGQLTAETTDKWLRGMKIQ